MVHISRYCRIQHRTILQQGAVAFSHPEGDLDTFLDRAFTALSITYPKFYKMDRLSKLGFLGAEVLLRDIPMKDRYNPQQVAVVLSNAHSSLDTDIRYFDSTKTFASPALFVYTLTNIVAGEISIRHGFKGENAFFVSEKFDARGLCDYVDLVMATEKTSACIAGWVDVMGDQHDVFLYLVEKQQDSFTLEHSAQQLQVLYDSEYGKVDGKS